MSVQKHQNLSQPMKDIQKMNFLPNHSPSKYYHMVYNDSNGAQTLKILSLQQQLLKAQKQISKKQNNWEKQRSNLLTKQQITNMQIVECKQRLSNMAQLNQTLTDALESGNLSCQTLKQLECIRFTILGVNKNKDSQKQQKKLHKQSQISEIKPVSLQNEYNALRQKCREQNSTINELLQQNKIYQNQRLQNQNKIKQQQQLIKQLSTQIQNQQDQILKAHLQISQITKKNTYQPKYSETKAERKSKVKINKKQLTLQQLNGDEVTNRKYSSNSSYLMLKPTSDSKYDNYLQTDQDLRFSYGKQNNSNTFGKNIQKNNHYYEDMYSAKQKNSPNNIRYQPTGHQIFDDESQLDSDYPHRNNFEEEEEMSWFQEQQEHLLCQVCQKVYNFTAFQHHLPKCGYQSKKRAQISQLLKKRNQIKHKMNNIKTQQIQNKHHYYQQPLKIRKSNNHSQMIPQNRSSYAAFSIKNNF